MTTETTTVADLLTLIEDAVKYDQKRLMEEGKCAESGTPVDCCTACAVCCARVKSDDSKS